MRCSRSSESSLIGNHVVGDSGVADFLSIALFRNSLHCHGAIRIPLDHGPSQKTRPHARYLFKPAASHGVAGTTAPLAPTGTA